ncbi:hypothetical protein AB6A40_008009 [Gnathostoma spinigerum]|uniref:Uncharacterized protein n=1 Tax=Gnathostoma spinigerum TaxID=75299 RepID=A0ABD6EYH2_9BILA
MEDGAKDIVEEGSFSATEKTVQQTKSEKAKNESSAKEGELNSPKDETVEGIGSLGEPENIEEPPLGWDAGSEQVKEMGWGDLPPTSSEETKPGDNGASSWGPAAPRDETAKQSGETVTATPATQKGGRRGNSRRAKYTDVTDQLGFVCFFFVYFFVFVF